MAAAKALPTEGRSSVLIKLINSSIPNEEEEEEEEEGECEAGRQSWQLLKTSRRQSESGVLQDTIKTETATMSVLDAEAGNRPGPAGGGAAAAARAPQIVVCHHHHHLAPD